MLSFLTNIKKKLSNFVHTKQTIRRLRNYAVVSGNDIMTETTNCDEIICKSDIDGTYDNEKLEPSLPPPPPPPSPVIARRLFNIDLDVTIIKNDYELQELLKIMDIHQFDVSNVTLENRIEKSIHNINNTDVVKIKMRLLYIIIANGLYHSLFEEKKKYPSKLTTHYVGVFRYNDYIIRIDDCPYCFIDETNVITATSGFNKDSCIIRPFLIYTNIRRNNETNDICDCSHSQCDCKYTDNEEYEFIEYDNDNAGNNLNNNEIAKQCFNKLRKNTISFSIQYYIKNTISLYNWVKDNLAIDIYNQFSAIRHIFFIELFYQCASLLREIHSVSIVHGDIKPDNILIREHADFIVHHPEKCKNFTIYLIDFGLSGFHKNGIGTGGTIPYCHPEFKNIIDTSRSSKYNWKTLDMKHDVWSLGITFLTMYIYRDFYNYYHKYPNYFFLKNGYVSSLIIDVITDKKINVLFSKILTPDCIPIQEVCDMLQDISLSFR